MQERLEALERRLESISRRNRGLGIIILLGVAAVLLVGAAQSEPDTLKAKKLQLVDDQGRVRASLQLIENAPVVSLTDESGQERLRLVTNADETGLFIRDDKGVIRVGAAQFAHGGGGFALHGPDSKGAAVLYLKGEGSLSFFDAENNRTLRVPAAK